MSAPGHAARAAAAALVAGVLERGRSLADQTAAPPLTGLAGPERARALGLASGVLRHLGRIDAVLAPHLRKPPPPAARHALRLATAELFLDAVPPHAAVDGAVRLVRADPKARHLAGLVNAVARRVAEAPAAWAETPEAALPGWLDRPVRAAWGTAAATAIRDAHLRPAPLDFTLRDPATAPAWAEALRAELLPTGGLRRAAGAQVSALPGFAEGAWWVQDAGAALPARMLGAVAGLRVLDLCAAPGGKTLQLAAAGAEVTALDAARARLARVEENLARTRLRARLVAADARSWEPEASFDAILLDAPCSASGTIRRHPDLPHLPRDVGPLRTLQATLLARAWDWLAPGGRLVYATCSLLPAEGEAQLAAFCAARPEVERIAASAGALGIEPRLDRRRGRAAAAPGLLARPWRRGRLLRRAAAQARPRVTARAPRPKKGATAFRRAETATALTNKTFAAQLLDPARRARNRLLARSAGLGPRPTPAATLPEPMYVGEADRGARLVRGLWDAGGRTIDLAGGPIWAASVADPRLAASRESCGWIDDLAALANRPARVLAQGWVQEWIRRCGGGAGPGWTPELTGLRAMRWVAHAGLLTDGLDPTAAERFWRALAAQQRYLARAWDQAAPGLARLRALAGLVWTGRALPHPGHAAAITRLGALAAAAVGPEGEVVSRRPEDLAETLALLVWTARLLEDAGEGAAPEHLAAIVRMVPTLRPLRMGDGGLARFHGGGAGAAHAIDKALAELRLETQPRPRLPMGYIRLTGGRVTLVMDGAGPPAGVWAEGAHAGALAFEMSAGRQPLVVNVGPGRGFEGQPADTLPGGAGLDWAEAARRTPAHSTVEVDGASSAAFVGGVLTAGPTLVSVRQAQDASGMWLLATQDGYVASKGLLHERRIFVDARGAEARGEEILSVTDARARAAFDRAAAAAGGRVGFAARFHLHPGVDAAFDPVADSALLTLPSGETWEFRAGGGEVTIEDSAYLGPEAPVPRPSRQVVVRAEVVEYLGQITWSFGRIGEAPRDGTPARRR